MSLFERNKKKFGQILIEKGLATKDEIEEALRIQRELNETKRVQKKIGVILNEKGIIELADIENTLHEQRRMEGFILKGLIYSIFNSK